MNSTGITKKPTPEELNEVIHWALAYMVYRQGGHQSIILPDDQNDGFDMTIERDGQFLTITVTHD